MSNPPWLSGAKSIPLLPFAVLTIASLLPAPVAAQPREGHFVNGALGYGLSGPYDGSEVRGTGVLAKGEYVYAPSSWAGARPYGGMVLTWRDRTDWRCVDAGIDCEVTAKIGVLGAKGRLAIPIPWVAPFFELGAGLSFGNMRTRTPEVDRTRGGVLIHVPVSIGLAIGPEHEIEVAFVYYYHPVARQFAGAAALGVSGRIDIASDSKTELVEISEEVRAVVAIRDRSGRNTSGLEEGHKRPTPS